MSVNVAVGNEFVSFSDIIIFQEYTALRSVDDEECRQQNVTQHTEDTRCMRDV